MVLFKELVKSNYDFKKDETITIDRDKISYPINKGKGYALSYGFQFSSGDMVMFLDADSDLPPQQIPRLLNSLIETGADGIIGSKSHPEAESNGYPATRKFLSKGYNLLVRALFNLPFTNTQTGLKVFRREVLSKIIPKINITGWAKKNIHIKIKLISKNPAAEIAKDDLKVLKYKLLIQNDLISISNYL